MRARTSPNFDDRGGAPVDILVLHYTGMETAEAALARLIDPSAKVSAHYLIDEAGGVTHLVDERWRAWHAGQSFWRGVTDVNARSIGIELVNPGHEFGYRPFPQLQMAALTELAGDILTRHPIPARNVVGHSDVAPRRKMDPGELLDWRRLAETGIGLWPEHPHSETPTPSPMDMTACLPSLAAIGYETIDPPATLRAFQRRYRPACIDGRLDGDTARRIRALAALLAAGEVVARR
ncbi:MAG: N-acetylmuramoyl-L-alanine amidase [Rhodospirillales bacterium]